MRNRSLIEEVLVDEKTFNFLEKYKEFNKLYFNNKLPTDVVEKPENEGSSLKDSKILRNGLARGNKLWLVKNRVGKNNAGACHYAYDKSVNKFKPVLITLRSGWDYNTQQDLDRVILHEMCHAMNSLNAKNEADFIKRHNIEAGHGPTWRAEMSRVEKLAGIPLGGRYLNSENAVNFSGNQNRLALIERGEITFKNDKTKDKEITKLRTILGLGKDGTIGRHGEDTIYRRSAGAQIGGVAGNVSKHDISKIYAVVQSDSAISFYLEKVWTYKVKKAVLENINSGYTYITNVLELNYSDFKNLGFKTSASFPANKRYATNSGNVKNILKLLLKDAVEVDFEEDTQEHVTTSTTKPKSFVMVTHSPAGKTGFAIMALEEYKNSRDNWPDYNAFPYRSKPIGNIYEVPSELVADAIDNSQIIQDASVYEDIDWVYSSGDRLLNALVRGSKLLGIEHDDNYEWETEWACADYEHEGDIDRDKSELRKLLKEHGLLDKVKMDSRIDYDYEGDDEGEEEEFEGQGYVSLKGTGTLLFQLILDIEDVF
jgi:hypothetical protein